LKKGTRPTGKNILLEGRNMCLFGKKRTPSLTSPLLPGKVFTYGINAYPSCPLEGCIGDVKRIVSLSMDYGFSKSQICVLTDRDATTKNILNKMEWLVKVQSGDAALLHNSCHGIQTPTSDPTEPDGLSEAVCPFDFDWSKGHMIIDKQFVAILAMMPPRVAFNWISDSCHSGDLDRAMLPAVREGLLYLLWRHVLGVPVPTHKHKMIRLPSVLQEEVNRLRAKGRRPKGMVNGLLDVGFISGCRSDQTSADAFIDNAPNGAATYYIVKTLRAMPRTTPLRDVVAAANADLKANGYNQEPRCEGARAGLPFLSLG
jgi:hypothetical protein